MGADEALRLRAFRLRDVPVSARAPRRALRVRRRRGDRQCFDPSFGGIAKVLNDRGIPTSRGSRWQAVQVQRVVQAATSALAQSGIAPSPSPLSDPKLG